MWLTNDLRHIVEVDQIALESFFGKLSESVKNSGETQMILIDHENQDRELWRQGVSTRMRVSAMNGSSALLVFEQWCEPDSVLRHIGIRSRRC
jgi:hypothetical protein